MTLGTMATDTEQRIDFSAMREFKLQRLQEQLGKYDLGSILTLDPDNIRYITGTALGEWSRDKMIRWCILPREGDPVLFELGTAGMVKKELCPWLKPENIRPSRPWARGANRPEVVDFVIKSAIADIKAVLDENNVADMPLGVDYLDMYLLGALQNAGIKVANGWDVMWDARVIKSPDELKCIELAASMVDGCYEHIVDLIRPGVREDEIVGAIYNWLISHGCDHITGVNCVSGPRSNPHPHDYSDRMIRPGDLVFIDIIANYLGYSTCYYRTFAATYASQKQKDLYKKAYDWLQASIDVVKPGVTTADIASQWPTSQDLGFGDEAQAMGLEVGHGVGVSNHEKPFISRLFSLAFPEPIEAGMHFALETFAGDGDDGARIESQIIVIENGHKVITKWPCEELMVCNPR